MNILINASDLVQGGGIQVADSICFELCRFSNYDFIVVLSKYFTTTRNKIASFENVKVVEYTQKKSLPLLICGRDTFLDKLVCDHKIDVVISVFGPSLWVPRCKMISGFARAHLVMPDSPYYLSMNKIGLFKEKLHNIVLRHFFQRSTKYFYTENPMISDRLSKYFKNSNVETITNYYNQVFDDQTKWKPFRLPSYDGITFLTVSSFYPHKNLTISIPIARYLIKQYPEFKFRFVFTINSSDFQLEKEDDFEELRNHFVFVGKVDIDQCPSLYEQANIVFQPTLLECFTATYPEAMIMKKPIVTADTIFARGLCGSAAAFYEPLSPIAAAETLYNIALNINYQEELTKNGIEKLKEYDNYSQRSEKLIKFCEKIN